MTNDRADLLLTDCAVYARRSGQPPATAVAIRDGHILAVGSDDDIRAFRGPRTEVVDLGGRIVVPGFQDAHVHPVGGGFEMLHCNLAGSRSARDYADTIAQYAETHPDAPWIVGGGWFQEAFPGGRPTADLLDAVLPDRPAYLPNRDHHSAWVNSAALRLAGIDSTTPDPPDGLIERDRGGSPTGALHEGAMELVAQHVPPPSRDDLVEAVLAAQRYLHSLGITAWQDALIGSGLGLPDAYDAYRTLAANGRLTARVVGALWWDRNRGIEQVDEILARREHADSGRFRATTVKIMQDGVCETFTAAVLEPYLDHAGNSTGNCGHSFIEPEALSSYVTRLDKLGFQVHVHALGDRAVRETLDAFEAAAASNGPSRNRHQMAHLQLVHPDDIPRFAQLGVTANAQPLWACNEPQMVELTLPFLSRERQGWQYPWRTLWQSGARLAFGSDWPVSSPDPLAELHVAVNRTMPPDPTLGSWPHADEVFLPEQRLDLGTALDAFTMGSAYVNGLDDVTGTIEVGKFADLAVIDGDIVNESPDQIGHARVAMTLVDGRPVFDDL